MRGAGLLLLALAAARPRPHHRLARGGAAWSADEARYSRQLLAFGRDAHARLRRARVLVAGADAVGAEVAKDLALLGVAPATSTRARRSRSCASLPKARSCRE